MSSARIQAHPSGGQFSPVSCSGDFLKWSARDVPPGFSAGTEIHPPCFPINHEDHLPRNGGPPVVSGSRETWKPVGFSVHLNLSTTPLPLTVHGFSMKMNNLLHFHITDILRFHPPAFRNIHSLRPEPVSFQAPLQQRMGTMPFSAHADASDRESECTSPLYP